MTRKIWWSGAWVQVDGGGGWPTPSYTLGTASAVSVASSASTNTYGSWVELVASTAHAFDVLSVQVVTLGGSGVATAGVLSIGIGAAASEVELFAIPVGAHSTVAGGVVIVPVPVHGNASVRIAGRFQCETGSTTPTVRLSYSRPTATAFATAVDVLGTTLGTSRGVNMPTSNTYVEIISSTARAYQGLIIVPSAAGGAMAAESSVYTLATGAAASEVEVGYVSVATTAAEQCTLVASQQVPVFMGNIPAGTRIACKQSTGRNYRDVAVIGIRYP